jgi:hypothetical protein
MNQQISIIRYQIDITLIKESDGFRGFIYFFQNDDFRIQIYETPLPSPRAFFQVKCSYMSFLII